jgi:hypothetical protein
MLEIALAVQLTLGGWNEPMPSVELAPQIQWANYYDSLDDKKVRKVKKKIEVAQETLQQGYKEHLESTESGWYNQHLVVILVGSLACLGMRSIYIKTRDAARMAKFEDCYELGGVYVSHPELGVLQRQARARGAEAAERQIWQVAPIVGPLYWWQENLKRRMMHPPRRPISHGY